MLLGGFLREDVFNEKIAPAFHSLIEKYRESGAGAGVAKARSEVVSRVFEKLKIDGFSSKIEIKSDDLKKWVALAVAGGRNDAVKRSLEFESIRRDLKNGFSVDVLERWAAEAGLDDGNFRRQLNDLRSVSNNGYGEIPELGDRASVFSAFSEIVARYRAGKSLKFSSGGVGGLALGDSQSIGPLVSVSPTLGAGGGRVATVEIGGASGRGIDRRDTGEQPETQSRRIGVRRASIHPCRARRRFREPGTRQRRANQGKGRDCQVCAEGGIFGRRGGVARLGARLPVDHR